MSLRMLLLVRLGAPAVIIVLFWRVVENLLPDVSFYKKLDEKEVEVLILVVGIVYYTLPIRDFFYRNNLKAVNKEICKNLIKRSSIEFSEEKHTWEIISPIFYHFVDTDESLKKQSEMAYFNGAIWTTYADIVGISIIYALAFLGMWVFGLAETHRVCAVFFALAVFGFFGSRKTEKEQIRIGKRQVNVIMSKHQNIVRAKLNELVH